ncbi:hypothetical protein [Sphingomonas sp. RB1R13]|uniref:hypothetical protein n=1 Tax=Sphingomonas sp. RB1R13 TaxID=3096159 RepID=UPI002FCC5162
MKSTLTVVLAALIAATPGHAQTTGTAGDATPQPKVPAPTRQGLYFKPDAGIVYQSGDFRLTAWGFAERLIDPDGPDTFRRVRQGAEIDLPRIGDHLRIAGVYEIDLTDTNAFGINPGPAGPLNSHDFENLFVAVQDAEDPAKFRLLFGHNTSILSRDDNLSSGNLPTINRSLILEEHGSTNTFGAQLGLQVQRMLSPKVTLLGSIGDNRGGLNAQQVKFSFGRAVAGKIVLTPISDDKGGRKLTAGLAIDRTTGIRDRSFNLDTAVALAPIGGVAATGTKTSGEADIAYTFPIAGHPTTIEAEGIYSRFSESRSDVYGGYVMGQVSLFDAPRTGDLDLFVRYDVVSLGADHLTRRATQQAFRTGLNYNLPYANKLASLHVEYGHSRVAGPDAIVSDRRSVDEVRVGIRLSLQQYVRH